MPKYIPPVDLSCYVDPWNTGREGTYGYCRMEDGSVLFYTHDTKYGYQIGNHLSEDQYLAGRDEGDRENRKYNSLPPTQYTRHRSGGAR